MYPDKDKHSEADKKIPPRIRSRGNGLRPACHSIGDGYVRGRTLDKNSDEQSLTSQVDFGWALWKTQKTATFSQKAKNYLLDVCWTVEETCKATASNVTSQISSLTTFASHFSFIFIVFAHENNWLCLGISSREICRKATRQITVGSFLFKNFTSHAT